MAALRRRGGGTKERSLPVKGRFRAGMGFSLHPSHEAERMNSEYTTTLRTPTKAIVALTTHWPEYLMEAAGLGLFMISACTFVVLLEHPSSFVHQALADATLRRVLIGIAMGLTAIAIIYSPLGKRSGAHLNPAVSLTFWRLGKIEGWDAFFYIFAQFIGGVLGVLLATVLLTRMLVADAAVNYAVTVPGDGGPWIAF